MLHSLEKILGPAFCGDNIFTHNNALHMLYIFISVARRRIVDTVERRYPFACKMHGIKKRNEHLLHVIDTDKCKSCSPEL